jgi:hypothetical protein
MNLKLESKHHAISLIKLSTDGGSVMMFFECDRCKRRYITNVRQSNPLAQANANTSDQADRDPCNA